MVFGNKKSTLKLHGLIFGGFINVFLLETAMVGAVGKFWILAFLEAFKTKFNDSKKEKLFCFVKKWGPWPLCPPLLVRGPCLLIYSVFISFIFMYKYNYKIDRKSKCNRNYTKLTNKRKNHRKYRRTKRYERLSMELRLQILPGLEAKTYKRLRGIIASAGDFTG